MLIYHTVALLAAAFSAVMGFRRGFARRVPALIGLALGIVCCHIFMNPLSEILYGAIPSAHGAVSERYLYSTLSAAIILTGVYLIFNALTFFVGRALARGEHSILNNIGGALFSLFRTLLFLSLAYNLLLAVRPGCGLLNSLKSDDGNIVEGVMLVGPALTGSESPEEFAHTVQVQEARKIS